MTFVNKSQDRIVRIFTIIFKNYFKFINYRSYNRYLLINLISSADVVASLGSSPQALKVLSICPSSSILPVIIMIRGLARLADFSRHLAIITIVKDLPVPCVCHITPPFLMLCFSRSPILLIVACVPKN
ncbi:hypothetical protein RAMDARK_0991 [Rickettsia amblyommatis str. Darkwater]|uniref:Uncharacterized protein n=1 Tax=Rickettsia amblyommatis str. Ac/Pa TaxID=1359164 RepID=A0A0F3N2P7_RICAM|nr:hypothetical protein APHACPA_1322 [Rickettsia amblyommatis str. Ac/Pa]KJV93021.1 hypothetical protein RAMDARK_0991 [Rickettsia amblyommatis str. Darkwater]